MEFISVNVSVYLELEETTNKFNCDVIAIMMSYSIEIETVYTNYKYYCEMSACHLL